jgi:hypothetical protein
MATVLNLFRAVSSCHLDSDIAYVVHCIPHICTGAFAFQSVLIMRHPSIRKSWH